MTDAAKTLMPAYLHWRVGLAYGTLAAPLAFVSLPLYVNLPHHYATVAGTPLAALGGVLLATRALDALVDPALGRWADQLFHKGLTKAWVATVLGSVILALAFFALWHPPLSSQGATLAWLAVMLVLTTLAYSWVYILHQAWGTRWGGAPSWRAGVAAWREGATLIGVLLASVLPVWLGLNTTSLMLSSGLVIGLWCLRRLRVADVPLDSSSGLDEFAGRPASSPWLNTGFRWLMAVFMLNGIASAVPATLLPFFVADRLQAPALLPLLLLCYFGAAALGLPLWLRAVSRWGLAPSWRIGMVVSVLCFGITPWLGAGDGVVFAIICLASGLALGADLALPGALLTGVIQQGSSGGHGAGRYLGWWSSATKLNLALAAGMSLPLLAMVGYESGSTDASALNVLGWAYGGLPCVLKLMAAAVLWLAERRNPTWRHTS